MAAIKQSQWKALQQYSGGYTPEEIKNWARENKINTSDHAAVIIKTWKQAAGQSQSMAQQVAALATQAQRVAQGRSQGRSQSTKKRKTMTKQQIAAAKRRRAMVKQQKRLNTKTMPQIIAQIRKARPKGKGNTLAQLKQLNRAQLVKKAKAVFRAEAKKASRSTTSRGPAARTGPLNKTKLARANRLTRGIRAGTVTAKQQGGQTLETWKDAPGTNKYERLANFTKKYKGVTVPGVRKARRPKSVKAKYAAIQGQKKPYYVAAKKKSVVDRSKASDGNRVASIRTVPGSGATPFRKLSRPQQRAVLDFLQGTGSKLRAKGAPRDVSLASAVKAKQGYGLQSMGKGRAGRQGFGATIPSGDGLFVMDLFSQNYTMNNTKPQLLRAAAKATGRKQSALKRHTKPALLKMIHSGGSANWY